MARRTSNTLTEVELEFMHILWAKKEASPEDMQKFLLDEDRSLTGGSIRKMLLILMRKGYVLRVKHGKKFVYSPKILQKQANKKMLSELINRAFDGSALHMIAALLDSRYVSDDIDKIEELIAERKEERKKEKLK